MPPESVGQKSRSFQLMISEKKPSALRRSFAASVKPDSSIRFTPMTRERWSSMLSASRTYISTAPWLGIFPGIFISLTLLAINLFGDALRDRLDPRMRK